MSTLVYMRFLERTPAMYDRGMRLLTLGKIDILKQKIASEWVEPDQQVLEIGCGTGVLAALMIGRGAHVVGIDISDEMLKEAHRNAPNGNFIHLSATEIRKFGKTRFDRIIATLTLSELTVDELNLVIRSALNLLKPDGKLIVADEVYPHRWWVRILTSLLRWLVVAVTFLLTRSTTHTLKMFEDRLEKRGFTLRNRVNYLFGTLALIVAEKR